METEHGKREMNPSPFSALARVRGPPRPLQLGELRRVAAAEPGGVGEEVPDRERARGRHQRRAARGIESRFVSTHSRRAGRCAALAISRFELRHLPEICCSGYRQV